MKHLDCWQRCSLCCWHGSSQREGTWNERSWKTSRYVYSFSISLFSFWNLTLACKNSFAIQRGRYASALLQNYFIHFKRFHVIRIYLKERNERRFRSKNVNKRRPRISLLIFDMATAEMLMRLILLLLLLFTWMWRGIYNFKTNFFVASFLCYCYEQRLKNDTSDCVILK